MNKQRLEEIKARERKATKGPWTWLDYEVFEGVNNNRIIFNIDYLGSFDALTADRDFMSHARQDIPDLLAHIDILEETERQLKHICITKKERIEELQAAMKDVLDNTASAENFAIAYRELSKDNNA